MESFAPIANTDMMSRKRMPPTSARPEQAIRTMSFPALSGDCSIKFQRETVCQRRSSRPLLQCQQQDQMNRNRPPGTVSAAAFPSAATPRKPGQSSILVRSKKFYQAHAPRKCSRRIYFQPRSFWAMRYYLSHLVACLKIVAPHRLMAPQKIFALQKKFFCRAKNFFSIKKNCVQ